VPPIPPSPVLSWVALACGGACGAIARFAVARAVQRLAGAELGMPWGTLSVNVVGSFLFGLLFVVIGDGRFVGEAGQPVARFGLLVGFLGAFTTFSTFAFETSQLLVHGRVLLAVGNVVLQNVCAVLAVALGIALARSF
jgi:CrcB protein